MLFRFLKYSYIKRKRRHRYVAVAPPYSHCKNCGHELKGQYCSVCGQYAHLENRPFGESLMLYLEHHYALDHKLGSSLYNLFFKPGMLTREYMKGRIERHVHPFKLYFFSSLLLFGLVVGLSKSGVVTDEGDKPIVDTTSNPTNRMLITKLSDSLKMHKKEISKAERRAIESSIDSLNEEMVVYNLDTDNSSSWEHRIEKTLTKQSKNELYEKFFHYLSLAILVLMPIFALLLLLFYRKKQKYYTPHLVHSIHIHVTLFLLISISILWDHFFPKLFSIGGWLMLVWLIYLVISLSKFYGERKRKSVVKAAIILFIYFIVALFAVTAVSLASILY